MARTSLPVVAALVLVTTLGACSDQSAAVERQALREVDVPRLKEVIHDDLERHRVGVAEAAKRLALDFELADPSDKESNERRTTQLRAKLERIQEPPRGIGAFISSPMSFLAAVGRDGKVIARDAEPDRMRGLDFSERYPVVRRALEAGAAGVELGEFTAEGDEPSSFSILLAHPVRADGEVRGAVVAGIPLWRMAQRLTRQLQADHGGDPGMIHWVYFTKGERLFHFGTPADLDALIPDPSARAAGLARSPNGFTGAVTMYGRAYGYVLIPVPTLGPDVAMFVYRSNPR